MIEPRAFERAVLDVLAHKDEVTLKNLADLVWWRLHSDGQGKWNNTWFRGLMSVLEICELVRLRDTAQSWPEQIAAFLFGPQTHYSLRPKGRAVWRSMQRNLG